MTTQHYVTYISAVVSNIQTVIRALASEITEFFSDILDGREMLSIALMVLIIIFMIGRFAIYWQQTIDAHYYAPVYTRILLEKILVLEERQHKFTTDISKLSNSNTFDVVISRLKSLENKVELLENNNIVRESDPRKPFSFQSPSFLSKNTKAMSEKSCRKRVRRSERAEVRECCRNLYGKDWWNHPNKSQRIIEGKLLVQAKRKLRADKDNESSDEKTE